MKNLSVHLRQEAPADTRAVELLTREAFWNLFVPGCDEHYLVHILRDSDDFIPELDIVAELDGRIIGNIMYAKSHIALDAGGELPVITFGPVSVLPEFQRHGIGTMLIEHTIGLAKQMGFPAIFILGDPAYYSRLGFQPGECFGIATEDNQYHAALQAIELKSGALQNAQGRFILGPVYTIDPKQASAFDQTFPAKEKLSGTKTQQRYLEVDTMCKPRG